MLLYFCVQSYYIVYILCTCTCMYTIGANHPKFRVTVLIWDATPVVPINKKIVLKFSGVHWYSHTKFVLELCAGFRLFVYIRRAAKDFPLVIY